MADEEDKLKSMEPPLYADEEEDDVMYVGIISTDLCGDGRHVGINFHDDDGAVVAHGHLELDHAERFLADYTTAVMELRKVLGRKPS